MAQCVIDWHFSGNGIANKDGTQAAVLEGGSAVAGPGATALGQRASALRFSPGVKCHAKLAPGSFDAKRFAVRISFRVTAQVSTRCNLVESGALPFSLHVLPGSAPDRFNISASVDNGATGWSGAQTWDRRPLQLNTWYVASLVYDTDTLVLMVDDTVVAVTAWPQGGLKAPAGDKLYVGTWVDGARWPFTGDIAGVQVWRDLPELLEARLDAERGNAEWQLTRKENALRGTLNLGARTGDFHYDPGTNSYIQPYAAAVLSYTEGHGSAFAMYGAILARWRSDEELRRSLGALASDEIDGRKAGSRKNLFARGALYWSPQTGAVPVTGRIYLDYEQLGEGASAIGLPLAAADAISGGRVQRFQAGKMFLRQGGTNAFEVHGSILAKYEATGGPARWGFPTTHESDVRRDGAVLGKVSEFERATIYWSTGTPACIVYGAIRDRYRGTPGDAGPGEGGPLGDLGFPTSDESDVPGVAGARYNSFQHGSILWLNGPVFVARPFQITLGRLDTKEEDNAGLDVDGQNDLYLHVYVDVDGNRIVERRYPDSGNFSSANIRDLNITLPCTLNPSQASMKARVTVRVCESDKGNPIGGGNDHLGTMVQDLHIGNAWGLANGNNGLFRSRNFGHWVNHLDWAVRPRVTPHTPMDSWGVANRGTAELAWREYAAAFSDVDPDFELDLGLVDDGLKAAYYAAVVKTIAANGNCFGMCLENIYAWKEQSRLGRPLARFTNWSGVEDDFNVKHAYQVGADAVWWFVGQFLGGNTHDPKAVFQASWEAFSRGENPVVCIAQNANFSGSPHCILPIAWERGASEWKMTVFDPNFPNQRRTLRVDPKANTFEYVGGSTYRGSASSGGRFHYMPWTVLNHRQRTPVWDAVMLLLGGVVVLFGEGTEVQSLTDERGESIDATASRSPAAAGTRLLRMPGFFMANGGSGGSLYAGVLPAAAQRLRPAALGKLALPPGGVRGGTGLAAPALGDAPADAIAGASLLHLARTQGPAALRPGAAGLDAIRCALRGTSRPRLDAYYKQGLLGVQVQGAAAQGEQLALGFDRMSGRDNEVRLQSDRARTWTVGATQKLGGGRDFLKITLSGLAGEAARPVALNLQPGTGALDVLTPNAQAQVQVAVDGVVGGRAVKSLFNTALQGGQRLVLPDLADPGRLKLGNIEQLMGDARGFRIIPRQ